MRLCKCVISIEPSHRMDVDESSKFWHLDKLNIVDSSSLRCRWSYNINSYDFNSNCNVFNSNYLQFEEEKSSMRRSSFFQSGPTLTTIFIVDEEREDSNIIKSGSSLARQRECWLGSFVISGGEPYNCLIFQGVQTPVPYPISHLLIHPCLELSRIDLLLEPNEPAQGISEGLNGVPLKSLISII